MLDPAMRRLTRGPLDAVARALARTPVSPGLLTGSGLATGLAAAAAASVGWWSLALAAWAASRLLDGLDGPLARQRGTASDVGGFDDVMADFTVYAAVAVGIAVGIPEARLAAVVLLATYYVSGTALLSGSAVASRQGVETDGRSLHLTGGLAEGTETIVFYAAVFAFPQHATVLLWSFSAAVAVTAVQRVHRARRLLRPTSPVSSRR
jgi:phosphatidylglycerophosphate synthase